MTTYYRVIDGELRDLDQSQYAALAENKRADLRIYIIDPQPVPTASQRIVEAGITVGPVEAHFTWALVEKTQSELDNEAEAAALTAEAALVDQLIADIKTQFDIDNAAFNALTNADKLDVLRADRRLLLRSCRFLLRRFRARL